MIVSHKHKFIFIKPHKTAGTSVELLLSRICGTEDVITPLGRDPDPNVRKKNNAKAPQNYFRPKPFKYWEVKDFYWLFRKGKVPNMNFWEHLHADDIKQYVGEDVWNSYFKIAIVRNPWDHAYSMYKWMSHYGFEGVGSDFELFLRNNYKQMWPFFSINGIYDIDYMIKFESLQADIKDLSKHLPSLKDQMDIPQTKHNIRKSRSYIEHYNSETQEIVRLKNLNVLEKFHYTFS